MTSADRPARSRITARTVRFWWWRARYLVVAVCCGIAASSAVQILAPPPPPMREVVVAARALAAGTELGPGDVEVRAVPASLVPADVVGDPAAVVGHVAAVRLAAGLPLSEELVAGGALAALAPAGSVVVPVRLDDVTAGLLRPGDHVDLVPTAAHAGLPEGGAAPGYLARRALVLPSTGRAGPAADGGGLLGGIAGGSGGGDDGGGVTLVAVEPAEAPALSAASSAGAVAAVVVP